MGHGLDVTLTRELQGEAGRGGDGIGDRQAEVAALKARHADIERRLFELGRHPAMTPSEQLECARLKKEKLAGKDRLAFLARAAGLA